ncbi:nitrate- and nitrite sensing domain-containing protein [Streptomyces sp. SL13]|uniref:histidine kinase n=1 Tax=Streptantibioticus silvisoli TaxID=2705255 RepID=A0AA90KG00_9ACTN|nr:nitrate- and nitrite sensing domain-containing protein [Streptantibioticus silvisoli]MDI5969539.1 nitrate- and nitrite sensing domain-containing protein [Streptantibioticus silvisoli]
MSAKRRLGNWRLRSRMLLLVLVPLVAIVPLVGVRVVSEVGTVQADSDTRDQTLIAQRISSLVSALDDERDLTEVALNGSGVGGDARLLKAERTTTADVTQFDDALRQYHGSVTALPPATQQLGARAEARLADIDPLRASNLRLGAGTPSFTAYTTVIDDLLDFSAQLAAVSPDHTLGTLVGTLASVEQIEQQTSSERGYLVDVLSAGSFTLEQKEDIEQAQAQFATAATSIANDAPASILNLYQSTVSGDQVGAADGTVEDVSAAAQEGTPLSSLGVSRSTAYQQLTDKLQAVRTVEQKVNADMGQRASLLVSQGETQLWENVGLFVAVIVLSYLAAVVLARSVVLPLRQLRRSALDIADHRLPEVVRRLHDAEPTEESVRVQPIDLHTQDEVGQVARAFDRVHHEAVRLATEQAMMRSNVNTIFTNLSRRSESLVLRQLQLIDELENGEQNPAQLSSLFQLDHLATRMRRNNENLLVLAGEEQGRRWNQPVSLLDVVRAATAEVEQYERVALYELPDVALSGHAATDVVHLVAELIENATSFSAPESEVLVSARTLAAGDVVLDIADSGIGIRSEELERINERLAEPPVVDVAISRRMGLFVVGRLAVKYRIQVWLTSPETGGLNALVRIPPDLLRSVNELDEDSGTAFEQAVRPASHAKEPSGAPEPGARPQRNESLGFRPEPTGSAGFRAEPFDPAGFRPEPADITGYLPEPGGAARFDPSFDTSFSQIAQGSAGDPRFDDLPVRGRTDDLPVRGRTDDLPVRGRTGPDADDFPWFVDEAGPQAQPDGDFSWFEQPDEVAPPAAPGRGGPQSGPSQDSGWHAFADPAHGASGSERSPIFDSMNTEWFGPEGRGLSPAAGPGTGVAPLPGHPQSADGRWPDRSAADSGASTSWAPAQDSWRPTPVVRPAVGGLTPQGLPVRVPRGNPGPGQAASPGASRPAPPPVEPRSADLMRERLSRFHQGVRQGKDGSGLDGPRPLPGGPETP